MLPLSAAAQPKWCDISVAQWSFQRQFYSGAMQVQDFPRYCAEELKIFGIDYLSDFFSDSQRTPQFLKALRQRAIDCGVQNLMIMCHGVGEVGAVDARQRRKILDAHKSWVDHAATLGCRMVRVNARSGGERDQQLDILADALTELCEHAKAEKIAIVIENLWGSDYSYKADFLAELIRTIDLDNCGALPDFNNFRYDDPYASVATLMPVAKAVSAKSLSFTPRGNEKYIDYERMLQIVYDSGYRGYIGIEYEGCKHSPEEGVLLTKKLIEKTALQATLRA